MDHETHRVKKGNQWFLGLKAHIPEEALSGSGQEQCPVARCSRCRIW